MANVNTSSTINDPFYALIVEQDNGYTAYVDRDFTPKNFPTLNHLTQAIDGGIAILWKGVSYHKKNREFIFKHVRIGDRDYEIFVEEVERKDISIGHDKAKDRCLEIILDKMDSDCGYEWQNIQDKWVYMKNNQQWNKI